MKGGTTSPSWSALVGGWTDPDPRKQNSLAYSRGPQIIGEVSSSASHGAPLLYQLTWMFRPILVSLSVHRSSLVLFRESTEVGHHPLKGSSLRYEGSFYLLGHLYLM
jgi:hypothetical protein